MRVSKEYIGMLNPPPADGIRPNASKEHERDTTEAFALNELLGGDGLRLHSNKEKYVNNLCAESRLIRNAVP